MSHRELAHSADGCIVFHGLAGEAFGTEKAPYVSAEWMEGRSGCHRCPITVWLSSYLVSGAQGGERSTWAGPKVTPKADGASREQLRAIPTFRPGGVRAGAGTPRDSGFCLPRCLCFYIC